eukprot:gene21228-biopygen17646
MGLGPQPVGRARSGGAVGARGTPKRPPPRLEATTSGPPYVWGWGPSYTTPK